MCISLLLFDCHPALLLLLAFNRDEFWDRPTQPAHFWPDEPRLLAGRDALRKGTWLGVTRHGRFALLTNFREPMNKGDPTKFVKVTSAPTRGELTTNFLTGNMTPLQYLQSLDLGAYWGFNLLVGDLHRREVAYGSNRDPQGPRLLGPGHYGISNGLLQEWPKVDKCRKALATALQLSPHSLADSGQSSADGSRAAQAEPHHQQQQEEEQPSSTDAGGVACNGAAAVANHDTGDDAGAGAAAGAVAGEADSGSDLPWQVLFHHVMGDNQTVAPDQDVPLTGVGEHLDRRLSSIFIEPFEMQPGTKYGTRSQTVIAVWRDGRVEQRERYVEAVESDPEGEEVTWVWKEQQHEFELAPPAASCQAGLEEGTQQLQQQQHRQEGQGQPAGAEEQLQQSDVDHEQLHQRVGDDGERWHMCTVHLHQQQQQQQEGGEKEGQ